jgi:hypothetical protein
VLSKRADDGDVLSQNELDALHEFAYETLDQIMQGYCHPYTYFGNHPSDGSDVGCWVNYEGLEEDAESGEIQRIEAGSLEALQLTQGKLPATTDYVWVHNEERNEDSLWDMKRKKPLWTY